MYVLGDPDRPPVIFRAPQAYFQASGQGATGTALALFHRTRTGIGQLVDVSMQEAVTATLHGPGTMVSWWTAHGTNIRRQGGMLNLGYNRLRVIVPCKDGYTANNTLLGSTAGRFPTVRRLLEADGMAEDLVDPKWPMATAGLPGRGQWQCTQADIDHLYAVFERWQMRYTKAQVLDMAVKHGLLVYPVNDTADLLASSQLRARGYFVDLPHPELGESLRYAGPPYRLSLTPAIMKCRAPLLGEHNRAVYQDELGLDRHQLATLMAGGVV